MCSKFINYTFKRATTKALIRLRRCVSWSGDATTSGFLSTRPISMITVIIIIALFFNVFTPWLGTKKNEPKREKRDTSEIILVQKSGPALAVHFLGRVCFPPCPFFLVLAHFSWCLPLCYSVLSTIAHVLRKIILKI